MLPVIFKHCKQFLLNFGLSKKLKINIIKSPISNATGKTHTKWRFHMTFKNK